ncbi:T9SS type A sorting domain-containing protein [Flavobacterium sedimenticola]|uniref:T9SS type A sorting domain-containing protein n=1 Tax=Flavobacterium sedimenticola TaxID=3043286 RepID=A0ABT6XNT3_9FLAO|nr:T9SS type A sorting domain-containing protein [Flavobacterium sedimenticola]MDI9256749.1 T9SS type A sorting domain-containing protein [Flavobacterium sedimenticola]
MSKVITKTIVAIVLLVFGKAKAQQWELVTSLPETEFTAIHTFNGRLYAATENKLYATTDGSNWQVENIHPVAITPSCITVYNNVLYVGTMADGVYFRNLSSGVWQHALMGLHISTFTEHEGRLHLCSQGSGVWRNMSGTWNNMTYNLPTYSYTVNKIISQDGKLLAFAGANGTFYRFDPTTLKWIEDYYSNGYQPGLSADDAVSYNGTILMARGNRLLRSEDTGDNWISDNIGLINGISRFLYPGAQYMYALTLDPSTNHTYFQKRNLTSSSQTSWGNFNEELPFYSYAMAEFNNKMYIASGQGVFVKATGSLGVENPTQSVRVTLAPNPTANGIIYCTADSIIDKIEVYDTNGRRILTQNGSSASESVTLPSKGLFLIKMETEGQIITKKAIVQ